MAKTYSPILAQVKYDPGNDIHRANLIYQNRNNNKLPSNPTGYVQPALSSGQPVVPPNQAARAKVRNSAKSPLYSPSVRRIGQPIAQAQRTKISSKTYEDFDNTPTRALAGIIQGISPVDTKKDFHPAIQPNKEAFTESTAYKAGEIGGMMAQFAIPYAGAAKGITALPKVAGAGNVLGRGIGRVFPKVSPQMAQRVGQGIAGSVATDLAVGLPLNTNIALNKEGLRGTDAAKNIAVNTGIDLVTGGILEVIGGVILKSGRKVASKADFDTLPPTEKQEVMTELERLAYESNVRKGKITPQGPTLYGNAPQPIAGELPAPKRINPSFNPVRRPISDPYKTFNEEYSRTVGKVAEHIRNYKGKGVQVGVIPKNGDDLMRDGVTRFAQSGNEWWYQDFHKRYGRAPLKSEAEEIAKELVDDSLRRGNGEFFNEDLYDLLKDAQYSETVLPKINREIPKVIQRPTLPRTNRETPFTVTPGELSPADAARNKVRQSGNGSYTPEQIKTMGEYANAVDNELLSFTKKVRGLQDKNVASKLNHEIFEAGQREIKDIAELTGADTTGYKYNVNGSAINHEEIRHGASGKHDATMADPEDFARMGYTLKNYDSIELLRKSNGAIDTTTAFRNSDSSPAPKIKFRKRVNGIYHVVVAVPDSQAKQMQIISAYTESANKKGASQALLDPVGPQLTSKTLNGSAPNYSISQPVSNVNGQTGKTLETGEQVIGLERGNKGTIAKRNEDGSYLVHFLNKSSGKEALIKMRRDEFEPVNQTIMDLKAKQQKQFEPQHPTASNKLDEETKAKVSEIAPTIKDISGRYGQVNDIWEIFEKGFGKNYNVIKAKILDPFSRSKGEAARLEIDKATELKNRIVNELGIKKGSREDKAIMWYGEKKRVTTNSIDPQTGMKVKTPTERPYTLTDLQEEFPHSWKKIVEADAFFRKNYDEFIDSINAKRAEIYPNAEENLAKIDGRIEKVRTAEGRYAKLDSTQRLDLIKKLELERERYIAGKRIPKRSDYYRHYKEMTEGFAALKNVFDSPAQIGSNLAGISQFTKPKSKFLSFAQQRTGNSFEESAIGGYLDYLPAASYAVHIDPHISKFRELADILDEATDKSKNANNLIRTIREYADHLAGKTNKWDRIFEDMPGGRKGMKVVNWINNRVKSNVILGNASSALSQVANIPNGIAWIKDPESLARGMFETLKGINKETAIRQSNFITERYKGNALRGFDESLISRPKRLAEWILENADAVGTRFIWNSAYQKALKNGAKDALQEADDVTRMLVAGRGIGEVPMNQQRNLTKIMAPFTLEVQNAWRVQRKFVKEKDFGGLLALYLLSYGFNKGMEEIKGNGVLFDPIQAIYDAVTEEDLTPAERVGRVAGEAVSNIPYGSTLANLYPEYGITLAEGMKTPSREKLFGRNDPTRFGSGLVSQQAIADPVFKLLPGWGGGQLKKTYDGLKSTQTIPNLNPFSGEFGQKQEISAAVKNGKMRFPISRTPSNVIKASLFGNYATDEGKAYIENEGRPFSEKQTEKFKELSEKKESFDFISETRNLETKGEILVALQNSGLDANQKKELLTKFYGHKLSDDEEELKPKGISLEEYQKAREAQMGQQTAIGKALALEGAGYGKMISNFEISDKNAGIAEALKKGGLGDAYLETTEKISGAAGAIEKKSIIDRENPRLTRAQLVLLYEAFDVSEGVGRYKRKFKDKKDKK